MDLFVRNFPGDLHRGLKVESAQRGVTLKALLDRALREWLAREGVKVKRK